MELHKALEALTVRLDVETVVRERLCVVTVHIREGVRRTLQVALVLELTSEVVGALV